MSKPAQKAAAPAAAKPAAAPAAAAAKPAAAPAAAAKPAAAPAAAAKPAAAPAAAAKPAAAPAAAAKPAAAAAPAKQPVPETVQKQQKTAADQKSTAAKTQVSAQKKARETRRTIFKRAEQYAKEYRATTANVVRFRRQAKNNGQLYVEDEPKVLFVLRIRGINAISPKTKKILQLLRLRQVHNGVFVRVNKAMLKMLHLVEPYITYGAPTVETVRALIYKRGYGKVNKQRIALTENKVVSETLGKDNIICVEDLIHEIATAGPAFKQASNFLWPFKLSSPNGGFVHKGKNYAEGGDHGDRGKDISKLIRRML